MQIGIIQEIDKLGRLMIPKEMRKRFSIDGMVELVLTEEGILIKKPMLSLLEEKISKRNDSET